MVAVKPCRKFLVPTGPNLAAAEHARERIRGEYARDRSGVVAGHAEHVASASVAGEEERTACGSSAVRDLRHRCFEIFAGAHRITYVEPHRLADADLLANGDRAAVLVDAEHAPHEKVAALVLGLVLVDDEPGEHTLRSEALFPLVQLGELGLEPLERRLAGQLADQVVLCVGDYGFATDRGAALRDRDRDRDVSEDDADGALVFHVVVEDERLWCRAGRPP